MAAKEKNVMEVNTEVSLTSGEKIYPSIAKTKAMKGNMHLFILVR